MMRSTGWNGTLTIRKTADTSRQSRRDGTPILSWSSLAPMQKRVDRLGVYYGFKSMNSHIHLLEAFAELKKIDDGPVVTERLAELFSIVRDRIAVEPGRLIFT